MNRTWTVLRTALGWAFSPEGDPARGLQLVGYSDWLWRELGMVREQRRWCELALTCVDGATPPSVEARIRLGLGWDFYGGDTGRLPHNLRAIELLRQAARLSCWGRRWCRLGYRPPAIYSDVTEAKLYNGEALSVLRPSGRTKVLANALMVASAIRRYVGDSQAALAFARQALALSKALGDVRRHDFYEAHLSISAFAAGELAAAIDRARRAVEASRLHGNLTAEFMAQRCLAAFLILDDQVKQGHAAALQALELSRQLWVNLPGSIDLIALVLAMHGETDTVTRLTGFADGYADRHQLRRGHIITPIRSRLVGRLHAAMSPHECQAAMTAGATWSEQEAVAVAQAA